MNSLGIRKSQWRMGEVAFIAAPEKNSLFNNRSVGDRPKKPAVRSIPVNLNFHSVRTSGTPAYIGRSALIDIHAGINVTALKQYPNESPARQRYFCLYARLCSILRITHSIPAAASGSGAARL
jgi:hypothetical protein